MSGVESGVGVGVGRRSWQSSEVQGDGEARVGAGGWVSEQGTQLLQVCAFGSLVPRVFPGFIFSDSDSRSPGWSQKSAFLTRAHAQKAKEQALSTDLGPDSCGDTAGAGRGRGRAPAGAEVRGPGLGVGGGSEFLESFV